MTLPNLNNISIRIDRTECKKDDIAGIEIQAVVEEIITAKTFGSPVFAQPAQGVKSFSISAYCHSDTSKLLDVMLNTRDDESDYHTVTIYNGAGCTYVFSDALLNGSTLSLDVDAVPSTVYSFVAKKVNISRDTI